jgi:hypothetical protein
MASNLPKIHLQTLKTAKPSISFPLSKTHFSHLPFYSNQRRLHQHHSHSHVSFYPPILPYKPISIQSSISSSTPPTSKEEAVLQAKTCLSSTLEKPLNNPKLVGKLKKLKQPRFRVEIPVIDDSPASLSQLASDVFQDLPIKRKGSPVKVLFLWPNFTSREAAMEAWSSTHIEHMDISSVVTNGDTRILNSAEVAIFLAPETSQLTVIKAVTDSLYPKPVVIFNPKWTFEEESDFGELGGFVGSFEVIYSFMGLEVRGVLSRRKGVIFKCVRDGVVSGERWAVLVEEEGGGLKVISRFKTRPSIAEVENVLYNLMAVNSPITKSAKFLRDFVSNMTGKKVS